VLVLAALAGCADLLGFEDFAAGPPKAADGDAGGSDGGSGIEADWYVSALGDDANSGSLEHPLRTIKQAVFRASTALGEQARAPQRIAVCAGDYPESALSIQGAIDLRGGYDCRTWTRLPDDPDNLGPSNPSGSKLTNTELGESFVTLASTASGSPHLDGFQIEGKGVAGVVVVLGGDAVLTELAIRNSTKPAPGAAADPTTVGLVLADTRARVERCSVTVDQDHGDWGVSNGSALGVFINRGAPAIRTTLVRADHVLGTCQGVSVFESTGSELSGNLIQLTNCIRTGTAAAAIGIASINASSKSSRNGIMIEAPGALDPQRPTAVAGFNIVGDLGTFESDGDRIVAPLGLHTRWPAASLIFQGFQGGKPIGRIVNASIRIDSTHYPFDDSAAFALLEQGTALIAHNSIYYTGSSSPNGSTIPLRAFYLDEAAAVDASAFTFAGNLVVSDSPGTGFIRARCGAGAIEQLAQNRYAGLDSVVTGSGCATGALDDLWPDAAGSGNLEIHCPSPNCAALFVESGSAVARDGLRLSPTTACDGGLRVAPTPGVTTDGSGAPRGDAGTMAGAFGVPCN
jgi:hypothetical protein